MNSIAQRLFRSPLNRQHARWLLSCEKAAKEVTANSPLQYLKKIRLSRARDLIVQKNMKAYLAADAVGYESPSQFSREFKRHYGLSPAEMMRELKSA